MSSSQSGVGELPGFLSAKRPRNIAKVAKACCSASAAGFLEAPYVEAAKVTHAGTVMLLSLGIQNQAGGESRFRLCFRRCRTHKFCRADYLTDVALTVLGDVDRHADGSGLQTLAPDFADFSELCGGESPDELFISR